MSKDAPDNPAMSHEPSAITSGGMPPAEELAAQTISRLASDGYTSSLMKLSRPLLNELGRRLVEAGSKRQDVIEWLNSEADSDIPERNIDRFAQRYREVFKLIWAEWANKLIIARLASDPDFDAESLQDVIKNRLSLLIAQEMMTSEAGELDTGRLNTALSLVIAADKGRLETAKLELARKQADDRAEKLAAELHLTQTRQTEIEARLIQAQQRFEQEMKQLRGESKTEITDEDIAKAREVIFGR